MQSVSSTDSRFIQVEKIFEELGSSSQMCSTSRKEVGCTMEAVAQAGICYIFKAYVVFITSKCVLKFENLPSFFCITIFLGLFRMLTDFNDCYTYSISFLQVLFCLLHFSFF